MLFSTFKCLPDHMRKIVVYTMALFLISCDFIFFKSPQEKTEINYGATVESLAVEFNLPAEFLKALIVLECSGRKKVPSRYEKHVFKRLQKVRDGKRKRYEHIKPSDLHDATDAALRNLSSSWGPFQLMGYKCLKLGIKVQDLRGDESLYWAIKWINEEYGNYLRQGRYEEAFRIHNTGSRNGKTHDPNYVSNGMRYIQYFNK